MPISILMMSYDGFPAFDAFRTPLGLSCCAKLPWGRWASNWEIRNGFVPEEFKPVAVARALSCDALREESQERDGAIHDAMTGY